MSRFISRERNEQGLFAFFEGLKRLLAEIQELSLRQNDDLESDLMNDYVELLIERSLEAVTTLNLLIEANQDIAAINEVLHEVHLYLKKIIQCLESLNIVDTGTGITSFKCGHIKDGKPGRPSIVVEQEQIEFLRSLHFPWIKIANLLGISESTLRRRRQMYDILDTDNFSTVTDTELLSNVRDIRKLTPNIGQTRLIGALRSKGMHIQRWRVRKCLRELDPVGTALRWRSVIHRRKYSVPGPNALWHIDGNHKLVRWKLVMHLCIDGYSRLIIYAHCANNNRAETVLQLFKTGVEKYALPSRVRSDYGMENFGVAQFMLQNRGPDRGSIITGSSVHNCRVERTHRDVYAGVLCFFCPYFYRARGCWSTGFFE